MTTTLPLQLPPRFHFEHTIYSHGWCALFPFRLSTAGPTLRYTLPSIAGKADTLVFTSTGKSGVAAVVEHRGAISAQRRRRAADAAAAILHLDLDLRPFYARIREDRDFSWIARHNTGRMLRGATFFEDAVKMILTTNCSWSLTTRMNERLHRHFGSGGEAAEHAAFPSPASIADSS
ncbi:MAG: hypothetical protein RRA94_07705, partial [Bacteroidota bacterium]|nr:hypothetical protein [Bacteroidota bacterium]